MTDLFLSSSSWLLIVLTILLTIILIVVAFRHRRVTGGIISLALIGPMLLQFYVYASSIFIDRDISRINSRIAQCVLFLVLTFIFSRLLKKSENGEKNE
jgi:uncharacterized membrane protein